MASLVIMPKLGFNMSQGKLVAWHKKEGESVQKGEALFSVETDKTVIDIESTETGVVRKLFIEEGDTLPVTLPIAIISEEHEDIDELLQDAISQLGTEATVSEPKTEQKVEKQASVETKKEEKQKDNDAFDVVVLGGGIGGYVAAIKSAQAGKKTAIVEKKRIGGTCLNAGCIPTKAFLRSVEALHEIQHAADLGIDGMDALKPSINMAKVQSRKKMLVSQLVGGVEDLLVRNGVTVFRETGEIIDRHTLKVGEKTIKTDFFIIATGSEVKTLPIPIDEGMNLYTSNEMLEIEEIPESIVVIGGGVIGVEFAYFLANAGSKVTIVEFLDRILPMVDEEITEQVSAMLTDLGIEIHTSAKVTEITADAVIFEKNGTVIEKKTDNVLMSVGRGPNLSGVNPEALGIKIEKGAIVTDNSLKTSVDNIYAIGDVNGKVMLAHTASMEGVFAVRNICGESVSMDYDKIPSAIYVHPEIASVGLTEEQARKKYGQINIGRFPLYASGKALVEGDSRGLVKIITEPKFNEIVGVHMYCSHATEMITETVTAMMLEGTSDEMSMVVHPHPTVSEAIMEAFWTVTGKAVHFL